MSRAASSIACVVALALIGLAVVLADPAPAVVAVFYGLLALAAGRPRRR